MIYRINARSEPFEEAFAEAGHPLSGPRRRVPAPAGAARRAGPAAPWPDGREVVARGRGGDRRPWGSDPEADPDDTEEVTRQADLGGSGRWPPSSRPRTRRRATSRASSRELARRFSTQRDGARREPADVPPRQGAGVRRGVPSAAAGQGAPLPLAAGRAPDPDEERRLLYVGITRARSTSTCRGRGRVAPRPARSSRSWGSSRLRSRAPPRPSDAASPSRLRPAGRTFDRLREWRRKRCGRRRRPRLRRVPRQDAGADRRGASRATGPTSRRIPGVGSRQARPLRGRDPRGGRRRLASGQLRQITSRPPAAAPRPKGPQARLPGAARRTAASIGVAAAVSERRSSRSPRGVPAQPAHRGRQRRAEPPTASRRPAAATRRRSRERPRLRDVGDQHREGAPGQREPQVGVERAAEQLQVVRHHQVPTDGDREPAARA